ncbi:MAG: ATP-binding cassette domain-containing protein, partial [Thermoplasmata archaeon]|nr:ATP-binding cassette domain-containing protein [Thermoplasmata archaeon]
MEFDNILIKAEGVYKQFGHRPVLRDINLEVRRGDKLVMLGSNGAGKSTLVRILLGIERPTRGTVWRRGQIGYV